MTRGRFIRSVAVVAATLGLCLPQVVLAGASAPVPTPAVVDVALADGGVLHGKLVDLQNKSVASVPVSVQLQNKEVAQAKTDKDGHFSISGLKGGVYQVVAGAGRGVYRLWTGKAAPPSAQKDAIVYTQFGGGGGGLAMLLANPIVVAGVVATAIAVPVAIANSQPASP